MPGIPSTPSGPPASIALRPIARADLPSLFNFQLDPEANVLAGLIPRSWPVFEAAMARAMSDPAFTPRAIEADSALVGSMARFPRDGLSYIGYWIDRGHWGRGIASRAVELFLREVPERPLYARVARHNAPSLRVLEKHGFAVLEHRWIPAGERELAGEVAVLVLNAGPAPLSTPRRSA